jgi:hypothetical protein
MSEATHLHYFYLLPVMTEIQQNSRLLNLPGELRTQIYHAVLNPDNGAEEYNSYRIDKKGKRRTEDRWPKHWLALIYTCRQIYAEAIGIVYGHLVFDFSDYTSENQLAKLHWFLDTIGLANVRSIRRIAMHAPDLWAIDPRNNGPGHATERETDGNIEGNNNVQGNGYDEVDSDTESLFNFIFPEDHDDEVAVEISQAGLECLETLRQRCPALDYLQLCFFLARRPPTKLPKGPSIPRTWQRAKIRPSYGCPKICQAGQVSRALNAPCWTRRTVMLLSEPSSSYGAVMIGTKS